MRPGTRYTIEDDKQPRAVMVEAVSDRSKIAIDYVDEIERTERGKLRLIAPSVPPEDVVGR